MKNPAKDNSPDTTSPGANDTLPGTNGTDPTPDTPAPQLAARFDATRAVRTEVAATGATLATTDANGTALTLRIPADALTGPVNLTLAPLTALTTLAATPVAGAVFGPSGLRFREPLTFEIPIPAGVNASGLVALTFDDHGGNLSVVPFRLVNGKALLTITHFSGAGLFNNTAAAAPICATTFNSPAASAEERTARTQLSPYLCNGPVPDPLPPEVADILTTWFETGVRPHLRTTMTTWEAYLQYRQEGMNFSYLVESLAGLPTDITDLVADDLQDYQHDGWSAVEADELQKCRAATTTADYQLHVDRLKVIGRDGQLILVDRSTFRDGVRISPAELMKACVKVTFDNFNAPDWAESMTDVEFTFTPRLRTRTGDALVPNPFAHRVTVTADAHGTAGPASTLVTSPPFTGTARLNRDANEMRVTVESSIDLVPGVVVKGEKQFTLQSSIHLEVTALSGVTSSTPNSYASMDAFSRTATFQVLVTNRGVPAVGREVTINVTSTHSSSNPAIGTLVLSAPKVTTDDQGIGIFTVNVPMSGGSTTLEVVHAGSHPVRVNLILSYPDVLSGLSQSPSQQIRPRSGDPCYPTPPPPSTRFSLSANLYNDTFIFNVPRFEQSMYLANGQPRHWNLPETWYFTFTRSSDGTTLTSTSGHRVIQVQDAQGWHYQDGGPVTGTMTLTWQGSNGYAFDFDFVSVPSQPTPNHIDWPRCGFLGASHQFPTP